MPPLPIIIDCDPGIDDAIALAMTIASVELDLVAVTTTYGNVGIEKATKNALRILQSFDSNAPVYVGAHQAILGEAINAAAYHGPNGMEAPGLQESTRKPEHKHAVTFLIDELMQRPDKLTVVALGPLTNIALALRLEPRITGRINRIVLMGGSPDYGNDSPSAEFNMLCDPYAAQIVLASGIPIDMFGLNVTHKVIATPAEMAAIRKIGNASSTIVADMIGFFESVYVKRYGFAGAALHDPCTIAFLLQPQLFQMKAMHVEVDTNLGLNFGRTVSDIWGLTGRTKNVNLAMDVDSGGFFDLLRSRLSLLN